VDFEFLVPILKIIAIDLVLSGDNAVVIAMASRRLPPAQRRKAIIWGGGGAVVLRIIFTVLAALLLGVPLLQAIGGLLLLYIAVKLLRPAHDHHSGVKEADTMMGAIRTIILADVVMSLDNMLAVGGAAHGHLWLLLFGLALSIPILLLGSSFIARLIDRYPWLNYVGAAILVHTALEMFFADDLVHDNLEVSRSVEWLVIAIAVAAVMAFGYWMNREGRQRSLRDALARRGRPFNASEPGD
jgi:YjbE family integral membrane protein